MKLKPALTWPVIIGGLLTAHVLGMLTFVWIANSNASYAVEKDYYDKAIHWDDSRRQAAVNAALGWTVDVSVDRDGPTGPVLVVRLNGPEGPVQNAVLNVEAFHMARSDDVLAARLAEVESGLYTAALPMRHNGKWELRFTADRGAEHFTHTVKTFLVVR